MEPHMSRLSFSLGALVLAVAGCAEPAEVATSAPRPDDPGRGRAMDHPRQRHPAVLARARRRRRQGPGPRRHRADLGDGGADHRRVERELPDLGRPAGGPGQPGPRRRHRHRWRQRLARYRGPLVAHRSDLVPDAGRRLAALPCGRAGPTARPGRAGRPPRRRAHRDPRVRPRPRLQPRAGSSRRAAVHGDRPHAGHLARSLRSGLGHELLRRLPHPPVGGRRRRGPGGLRERRRPDRRARRSRRRRPRRADRHQHQRQLRPALDRLRLHRLARVDLGLLRPARHRVRRSRRRRRRRRDRGQRQRHLHAAFERLDPGRLGHVDQRRVLRGSRDP
jgi:hypothetical protein